MAQWFYSEQGKSRGPVEEARLAELITTGAVRRDDLVWREGMAGWLPAVEVPEFSAVPVVEVPGLPVAASLPRVAAVPEEAVEALRGTKPWVRFLGILGFLGCGFTALVGLFVGVIPMPTSELPLVGRFAIAALYILFGAAQLPPALFLTRYASRIEDVMASGDPEALVAALRTQKSFWKYVGIFTLVIIALYALIFIGAIVAVIAIAAFKK